MGWIGQLFYAALSFFIPWLQSGSTEMVRSSGELSPDKLAGVDDLKLKHYEIPALLILFTLCLVLTGCAGQKKTIVLVEPGGTVEIISEKPVQSKVTDDKGDAHIADTKLAGTVAMPKSVYRRLRNAYIELQKVKQAQGESLPPLDSLTPEELEDLVSRGKPIPQDLKVK